MWRWGLRWLPRVDGPVVVVTLWAFSTTPCPGGVTQSHLGMRVGGAQVVIKSSVSLREDQHAFAKASQP